MLRALRRNNHGLTSIVWVVEVLMVELAETLITADPAAFALRTSVAEAVAPLVSVPS